MRPMYALRRNWSASMRSCRVFGLNSGGKTILGLIVGSHCSWHLTTDAYLLGEFLTWAAGCHMSDMSRSIWSAVDVKSFASVQLIRISMPLYPIYCQHPA